jgi:hypothetical protein
MHRSVLEAIQKKYGDEWFLMDNDYTGGGEDRRFFERAREVGFPAYVDRSCIAGHLAGDVPMGVMDFMAWESVSNFLGTGEQNRFRVENIAWKISGDKFLPGPPKDLYDNAVKMLEDGKLKLGCDMPDPTFMPLEDYRELSIQRKNKREAA